MSAPVQEHKIIPWEVVETVPQPVVRRSSRRSRRSAARRSLGFKWGVLLGMVLALLAAGTAVARRGGNSASDRALEMMNIPETVMHTVQSGDTLWSLAGKYGNPRMSITDRVDNLIRVNGFSGGASLHPGQKILLRIEHPAELAKLRLNRVENPLMANAR